MILGTAGVFLTCERNNLYTDEQQEEEELLYMIALSTPNTDKFLNPPPYSPPPPPPPPVIYVYSAGQYAGNLGGRSGADATCVSAGPPAGTTTVHAFLSVTASDKIDDLVPPPYRNGIPVVDAGGANIISTDWNSLWDGSIDITLAAAGVFAAGLEWWNGSNQDGTLNSNNCLNWSSGSSIEFGMIGNSNFTAVQWINFAASPCNTNINFLLCVAY